MFRHIPDRKPPLQAQAAAKAAQAARLARFASCFEHHHGHAVNQVPARKRQTETRTGPPPTFSRTDGKPRPSLPGLASRKNPILWAFFTVFVGLLNGLTAFRNEYLPPQELPYSETVSGKASQQGSRVNVTRK
jgi:hypothetical protein